MPADADHLNEENARLKCGPHDVKLPSASGIPAGCCTLQQAALALPVVDLTKEGTPESAASAREREE